MRRNSAALAISPVAQRARENFEKVRSTFGLSSTDLKSLAGNAAINCRKSPLAGFVALLGPVPATWSGRLGVEQAWFVIRGLALEALRLSCPELGNPEYSGDWLQQPPPGNEEIGARYMTAPRWLIGALAQIDLAQLQAAANLFGAALRMSGALD